MIVFDYYGLCFGVNRPGGNDTTMKILVHTDEYYPTAQACAYRMQVFVDTFLALGHQVTVITSSANLGNGSVDTQSHKEKILYAPAIPMKKKTTLIRMLNNLSFGISSVFTALRAGKADVVITTSPPAPGQHPGLVHRPMQGRKAGLRRAGHLARCGPGDGELFREQFLL